MKSRARRQLIKGEPGIQKILDALPFSVILVDADHHIVLANKAVRREELLSAMVTGSGDR